MMIENIINKESMMNRIKSLLALLLAVVCLASCAKPAQEGVSSTPESSVSETMSLEEKDLRAALRSRLPDVEERYYVNRLSGRMLAAFLCMYDTVVAFEDACTFPVPITPEEMELLAICLEYDCPELIQLFDNSGSYSIYWVDTTKTMIRGFVPTYGMTKEEYETCFPATLTALEKLLAGAEGKDPYEAELYLYEQLVSSCTYNYSAKNAHNSYGTLIEKTGRCEGFTRTLTWALRELDIPCFALLADDKSGGVPHSWNAVKIGDGWYEVDITHDIVLDDEGNRAPILYGHFNVSSRLHGERYSLWPICTYFGPLPERNSEEGSYHAKNGSYFTAAENFSTYLATRLDARDMHIAVSFSDASALVAAKDGIGAWINAWTASSGVAVSFGYSWNDEALTLQININHYS